MIDITAIQPTRKGDNKMITSAVTLSFPYLGKKNTGGEFPSDKYEANFCFSKLNKPLYDMIVACMQEAIKMGDANPTLWGAKGRPQGEKWFACVKPDKYAKTPDGEDDPNGLTLKATTQYPPALLDVTSHNVAPEEVDEVFYAGAIVRAQVEFFPWYRGGKGGVSAQLTVVQKLADGTPIGGKSYDDSDFVIAGAGESAAATPTSAPEGAEVAGDLPF